MTNEDIKAKFAEKIAKRPDVKTQIKFDMGDDGIIFVDSTQSPPEISEENKDAEATLILSKSTLEDIIAKRKDPKMLFMTGKIKVKGSMGTVMKIASIL
jgi:putative sterol carrier protein